MNPKFILLNLLVLGLLAMALLFAAPAGAAPSVTRSVAIGSGNSGATMGAAPSATRIVTNTDDSGPGSLRQTILDAAASPPGDTIVFSLALPNTITLTSGALWITQSLTISGPITSSLTINGNNNDAVFYIISGTVNITGLTIYNGKYSEGGGIDLTGGALTLANSVVLSNTALNNGGGIMNNSSSAVTLTNVSIISNTVTMTDAIGGGMRNDGVASLTNVTITNNTAPIGSVGGIASFGSAILNGVLIRNNSAKVSGGLYVQGVATLIDSSVMSNTATASDGGGIVIGNPGSFLTISNSAVLSNTTTNGTGGGIVNNAAALAMTNVTISGNHAPLGSGAGLSNYNSGTATLRNVTINNNSASSGGGISFFTGSVVLTNTIVANNPGGNCDSAVTSAGHNLDNLNTCGFSAAGDITDTIPLLGPLANNGGTTLTHALLPGSPAINAGTDAGCPVTDQRGVIRPIGPHCDIGAYEALVRVLLPLILK